MGELHHPRALTLLRSRLIIDAADRLQFVRGIVALLPDSGRARQLLASNLGAAGEDPRPLLEQALAFEPDFAPLLDELAGYLAVYADGARAVPLAQRAVARRPWSGAWVATLAAALAASGRCTEAATAQRLSIALTGSPGEKAASTLRAYESGCSADHPVLPSR